jgi:hypothetical protein
VFAIAAAIVLSAVGVVVMWAVAGLRRLASPDPTFAPEAASRYVSIMGGLAGFAVTGLVLLVGQTSNLAKSGTDFTNVLAMFVVAYMGLLSVSIQFASVSENIRAPFDLGVAQHTMAVISLYFIYMGWFALRPLFQAFGLASMANISSGLLLVANLAGYPLLGAALIRGGFARVRETMLLAAIGVVAAVAYVVAARVYLPGGHVPDGTLGLTLLAFVPGAAIYGITSGLPALAAQPRFTTVLRERWHLVILAYAVFVVVLVELLLVSVLGLA